MTDAKVMKLDDCQGRSVLNGRGNQRACDRCGKPFSPRHGTGGSEQRFCSRDCQRTSNRERQRTQRRASYAGPKTLPASGKPTQNEKLVSKAAVAELHPWETGVLDIANCERTEFVVALKDGEAAGTRVETWPPNVRTLMDRHVSRWVEENKQTRTVRAITVAAPKCRGTQSCVLILHHSRKHDNRADSSESKALDGPLPGPRGVS